ncbi:MAG TPA: hypothetical protein VEW95_11650 [Candidatus Limnocylindrales bacterium]|nr:hypothetical protein [Candidatus Limnocylindrales bacterium]
MRTLIASVVTALLLVGCSAGAAPADAPAETPTPDPGYITRQEYGDAWPFSVPAGTLACYDGAAAGGGGRILVTFSAGDGIEYGLNGSALDFGFPELDQTILPDYPNKTGVLDLIERGLALC